MTPTTPSGTRSLRRCRPLGRVFSLSVWPSGEGRAATPRKSAAMPARRAAVSWSRSYLGSAGSMRARSFAFSVSRKLARRSAASAIASSTASMVAVDAGTRLASRVASKVGRRFIYGFPQRSAEDTQRFAEVVLLRTSAKPLRSSAGNVNRPKIDNRSAPAASAAAAPAVRGRWRRRTRPYPGPRRGHRWLVTG